MYGCIEVLADWLARCVLSLCDSGTCSCVSLSEELVCFQGDRGPKGACGGDGPKGDKVSLRHAGKTVCG